MKKITALAVMAGMILSAFSACGSDPMSNEIAVDEYGDIDMEVALSYETDIDALLAELDAKEVNPADTVSENSNSATKAVFNYLRENFGTNVISAQQMFGSAQYEDALYYNLTGDLPAMKGFDMLFVTVNEPDVTQVDMAIEWYKESGGLVTFTWHWNVPRDIDNLGQGTAFYTDEIVNFSLENAVTPGTAEYERIIHDIDAVAIQLQRLEKAGVPVLWRPLHEASGRWFWWGNQGKESIQAQNYQKLWYIVFDRLENYHKLSNLIWVWNGQSAYMEVHPNTYDISGVDVYPTGEDHSAQATKYDSLAAITAEGKMTALTEVGYIPDINKIKNSSCKWLYYMPWYGEYVYKTTSGYTPFLDINSMPTVNTAKMSEEFLKEQFASENVITWSELPSFPGTSRNMPEHLKLLFPNG